MACVLVAIGDIHGSGREAARIPELAGADGLLVTGDMTNLGGAVRVAGVLEELRSLNPNVYAQIGNMDKPEADIWLSEQGINLHRTVRELAPGLKVLGLGYSATTPFCTPSEVPDPILNQWLDNSREQLGEYRALVLVSHTPPINTQADRLTSGVHVGSPAVRRFIEEVRPDLCLTGHIHESRGVDTLGSTTIINSGMLADGGYALVTYEDGRVSAELKRFK